MLLMGNVSYLTPLHLRLLLHCALSMVLLLVKISLHVRQQLMLQLKLLI